MLTHSSTSVTFSLLRLLFSGKLKISLKVCVNPVKATAEAQRQETRNVLVGQQQLMFPPRLLAGTNEQRREAPTRSDSWKQSKQGHWYLNWSIMIHSLLLKKQKDASCQAALSSPITTLLTPWNYKRSVSVWGRCSHGWASVSSHRVYSSAAENSP